MTLSLSVLFGRGTLPVVFPADTHRVTVIEKPRMPILPDPAAAMVTAFTSPVDCRPLVELAAGARSACILICDITRPVPNGLILPPVIQALIGSGYLCPADHRTCGDRVAPPQRRRPTV